MAEGGQGFLFLEAQEGILWLIEYNYCLIILPTR